MTIQNGIIQNDFYGYTGCYAAVEVKAEAKLTVKKRHAHRQPQ